MEMIKEMKMNGFPLQCEFKRERESIGFSVGDIFRNFEKFETVKPVSIQKRIFFFLK